MFYDTHLSYNKLTMLLYIIYPKIAVSSHFFISSRYVLDLFIPILPFIYSLISLSLPHSQKTQNTRNIYIFVSLFLTISLMPPFLLPLFYDPSPWRKRNHKMRGFCKCFSPLIGELPGKSLLLTFPPPKELHGMFFCHKLSKKQQGKTSLWMAYLRQITVARVERTPVML